MKLRDFFYIHKSDRSIFLVMLLVAVLLTGMEFLLETAMGDATPAAVAAADSARCDSARTPVRRASAGSVGPIDEATVRRAERFVFDPNTADSAMLLRLGLQPWQVRNIYKYRAAGGIYRSKEDFARVYGLTLKEYRELEPYIRISADYQPAALFVKEKEEPRDTLRFPRKLAEGETIDLATADTTQLKRVPGIGSYYAGRIIRYGERLGGYVRIDQLLEIEDLPADVIRFFTIEKSNPKKLNLNRLSLNELKRHPYLNYYQARAITDLRRMRGPLKSLDELRLLPDFTEEDLRRLAPYVSIH